MELYIKDRIYFPQLLPQQGNFMEFNMKREILKRFASQTKKKRALKLLRTKNTGALHGTVKKTWPTRWK